MLPSDAFRTRRCVGTKGDVYLYLRSECRECEKPAVVRAIKQWQRRNVIKMRATALRFRKRHPDRIASQNRRTWAHRHGASATLADQQWQDILLVWENSCAYCGTDLALLGVQERTQDHVVPLSRGGLHEALNVVPSCKSCNSSKCDKTPEEWRQSMPAQR